MWNLRELPERLVVLGGGNIGCELSQAFARFGSWVVQVEMAPRLLAREDPDVSEYVAERFAADGVDVAGPFQFTHVAAHQAWYAAVNALFLGFRRFKTDYSVIPWVTFTDPEIAHVGLNETQAEEDGVEFEVTRYDLGELDRAIAEGEAHGFIKVLTVPGKDKVLGATIVGENAGELIGEYVTAMRDGLGLNKILGTIHAYPTLIEANKYVAGEWKRAHAPERILAWLERFHTWRRRQGTDPDAQRTPAR